MSVGKDSEILPLHPEQSERKQRVSEIFHQFDANEDAGAQQEGNGSAGVSRESSGQVQISAILDEVFRKYGEYIEGNKGLSLNGILRT